MAIAYRRPIRPMGERRDGATRAPPLVDVPEVSKNFDFEGDADAVPKIILLACWSVRSMKLSRLLPNGYDFFLGIEPGKERGPPHSDTAR